MKENKKAAKIGGNIAKHARQEFEKRTGGKVVTESNFLIKRNNKKLKKEN